MNQLPNSRFKFFPQLNDVERDDWLSSANTFYSSITDRHFNSDSLQDNFLRGIAAARLLSIKEVFETFEFFARIRKSTKSRVVADLCCGHGLLGILFAMFERKVEKAFLVDSSESESRIELIEIANSVAPWVADKLSVHVARIDAGSPSSDSNCAGKTGANPASNSALKRNDSLSDHPWSKANSGVAIVSAHACGELSDACIAIAIRNQGPLAILPCCYPRSECHAPLAIQTQFGLETAFDIERTYVLEAANFQVRWAEIPRQITPMNRVIYAYPKKTQP